MSEHVPAEAFHPSEFLMEELEARGWSLEDLAFEMPGDAARNLLALQLFCATEDGKAVVQFAL